MCERRTNNSLASWDSGMWSKKKKKKKRLSRLCARNSFPHFAKIWAHSSGLSLCRQAAASQTKVQSQMPANMAATSCLWWMRGCDPASQNTTRKQNGVFLIGHFTFLLKIVTFLSVNEGRMAVRSREIDLDPSWDKANRCRHYQCCWVEENIYHHIRQQTASSERDKAHPGCGSVRNM